MIATWKRFGGLLGLGCAIGCSMRADPPAVPTQPKQKLSGVLVTSLSAVPGWTIAETKGMVCFGFGFDGHGKYWGDFDEALESARSAAQKAAANAWINVKASSASWKDRARSGTCP